jgi:hypothetical protein
MTMTERRKHQVTLVAFAPDGSEHKIRTAAQYDWAGLWKDGKGTWHLASKGWSRESVHSRARTVAAWGSEVTTVRFQETTSVAAQRKRAEIKDKVDWAGRTFGQLTADEKRRAARQAGAQLSTELTANAEAIGAVLEDDNWAGRGFTRR